MRSIAASAILIFCAVLAGCSNAGGLVPGASDSFSESVRAAGQPLIWAEINYGIPQSQNQVAEFDPATHSVLHTFDLNFGGPPPIAGPYFQRVYVPLNEGGYVKQIAVINAGTQSVVQIQLPPRADMDVLTISPYGHFLYAGGADFTYKIDPNSRRIVARGSTGLVTTSFCHAAAVSPDGKFLYNADGSGVRVLDTSTLAEVGEYPAGSQPYSVSVSADGRRLYVLGYKPSNLTTVSVVDTLSHAVVSTIGLGGNFPSDMVGDAQAHRLYVAAGADEIFVIDTMTNQLIHTILLKNTANSLTIDPVTHDLWFVDGRGAVRADSNTFTLTTYGTTPLNDAAALALTH